MHSRHKKSHSRQRVSGGVPCASYTIAHSDVRNRRQAPTEQDGDLRNVLGKNSRTRTGSCSRPLGQTVPRQNGLRHHSERRRRAPADPARPQARRLESARSGKENIDSMIRGASEADQSWKSRSLPTLAHVSGTLQIHFQDAGGKTVEDRRQTAPRSGKGRPMGAGAAARTRGVPTFRRRLDRAVRCEAPTA